MSLQLVDVDHAYGRHESLKGVSLTVEPGDRYGFLGHNGAGKTTSMRIALGLTRPAGGRVLVDGFDIREHPREARARMGGMIEITGFYPAATGLRNLCELARLQGLTRRAAQTEAARVIDQVGLTERADRKVGTYSQGMRQRLGLAQALLGRPRYVLLDEPTNGLDPEGIVELRAVLARLGEQGLTVLLSSHQLAEVAAVCNRIGVLKRGRMLLEADTAELLRSAGARYELAVDDYVRADACLAGLGVPHSPIDGDVGGGDDARFVELDAHEPAAVVRALVEAGVGVERFAPRPTTLEEVYLRVGEEGQPVADSGPQADRAAPAGRPAELLAPRWPVLRVLRYELWRGARPAVVAAAFVPALIAIARIKTEATAHAANLAKLAAGTQFSIADRTAYTATTLGLAAALPATVLIVVALASQSIAGDFSLGTLRNVVIRPATRLQVALGKAAAVGAASIAIMAITTLATVAAAGWWFEFADSYEMTKGDPQASLWIAAEDVAPLLPKALLSPVLPTLALAAVGFACGAIVRRAVWALTVAFGCAVLIGIGRAFTGPGLLDGWLPSTHLPAVTAENTSYLAYFLDFSLGAADAAFHFPHTSIISPALWIVGCVGIASAIIMRRHVP